MKYTLLFLIALSSPALADCVPVRDSDDQIKRSSYQVRKFRAATVCPSTGLFGGRCPGYVVDHIIPLCACGADRPSNMQFQTYADSKAKDVLEVRQCRALRR